MSHLLTSYEGIRMHNENNYSFAYTLGYQLIGVNDCGNIKCRSCMIKDDSGYTARPYEEGGVIFCDECNADIDSDYGDPHDE